MCQRARERSSLQQANSKSPVASTKIVSALDRHSCPRTCPALLVVVHASKGVLPSSFNMTTFLVFGGPIVLDDKAAAVALSCQRSSIARSG